MKMYLKLYIRNTSNTHIKTIKIHKLVYIHNRNDDIDKA